jgi:phosphate ABC transporter phosphate-binding protein
MATTSPTRRVVALLATAGLLSATTVAVSLTSEAPRPVLANSVVDGAGSTWSQIAVDQWRADVARQGLTINYQGIGSSAGRTAYYQGQVDFAVSEIPFQTGADSGGINEVQAAASRPYAYLPIVAGGTAFMYHLVIAGKRVNNLQLSPATAAKIFTGEITNWNHPEIAADNPGQTFPSLPIKVVIRSDGSGTSAQFTAFMADQTPAIWGAFCQRSGLGSSCPPTSLYPNPPGANFAAQQFSDGVANFVAAPYNNGSITYVEYGYAKERGFPVASVRNKAGFYTQPTAQAVAIALQGATINAEGIQQLKGTYEHPDPRAYPVSSYSYMIVPISETGPFNASEGQSLGNFILYFLCAGQQKAEQLGYSPLPRNLVQIAFNAVTRIPGAPTPPPIDSCNNPTITGNFLVGNTPTPPSTAPPSNPGTTAPPTGGGTGGGGTGGGGTGGGGTGGGGTGTGTGAGTGTGSGTGAGTGTGTGAGTGGGSGTGSGTGSGSGTGTGTGTGTDTDGLGDQATGGVADGGADVPVDDPLVVLPDDGSGELVAAPAALGGGIPTGGGASAAAVAVPVDFVGEGSGVPAMLYVLIVLAVLAGVFGVPTTVMILERRRRLGASS